MTKKSIRAFDAADYLDSDTVVAEYLNAALKTRIPMCFSRPLPMWQRHVG